jgi:hypothetical protein
MMMVGLLIIIIVKQNMDEWLALLLRIQKDLGSNLGWVPATLIFSLFPRVPPSEGWKDGACCLHHQGDDSST